jgi:hypothetical protein
MLAGSVAGLFVARDATNFVVVQAMVALFVIALVMFFVLAFWPARWTHFLNRFDSNSTD